jgi:death on curing protein
MTGEPIWLPERLILAIQAEQLATYGGASGVRDAGLLSSALARPKNRWAYGDTDLTVLAASYGHGIAKNHPFIDGNKRTALLAIYVFLGLNGLKLTAPEAEAAVAILQLASGELSEAGLAAWIAANVQPRV